MERMTNQVSEKIKLLTAMISPKWPFKHENTYFWKISL